MKFPTISALLFVSFSCVTSTATNHRVLVHARAPAMEYNALRLRKLQDVDDNSPSVDDTPDTNSVDDTSDTDSVDDTPETDSVDDTPDTDSVDDTPETDSVDDTPDTNSVDDASDTDSVDDAPDTDSVDDASDIASADTNPSADDTPSVDNPSADDPSVDDSSDNDSVDGTSSSTNGTQEGTSVLQMQEVSSSFRPLFMQTTAIAAASVAYFMI